MVMNHAMQRTRVTRVVLGAVCLAALASCELVADVYGLKVGTDGGASDATMPGFDASGVQKDCGLCGVGKHDAGKPPGSGSGSGTRDASKDQTSTDAGVDTGTDANHPIDTGVDAPPVDSGRDSGPPLCTSNAECSPATPHCDPDGGTCGACVGNDDCTGYEYLPICINATGMCGCSSGGTQVQACTCDGGSQVTSCPDHQWMGCASLTEIETCSSSCTPPTPGSCGGGSPNCLQGTCSSNPICTLPFTVSGTQQNPYNQPMQIGYMLVGGGGGGGGNGNAYGGGGGGSSAIVAGDTIIVAAGGAGGGGGSSPEGVSATPVIGLGTFSLAANASVAVYVGGGGGGGTGGGGGGGGSGYFAGGGGSLPGGGAGGTAAVGAAGTGTIQGTAGAGTTGGNGGNTTCGGKGGNSTAGGGMLMEASCTSFGGGGGSVGGGGGEANATSYPGGAPGVGGAPLSGGGGVGAGKYSPSPPLSSAAGQGGAALQGGNAGYVMLQFVAPNGTCPSEGL
jgi:hypothetical protein